jgi:hypothetical protein
MCGNIEDRLGRKAWGGVGFVAVASSAGCTSPPVGLVAVLAFTAIYVAFLVLLFRWARTRRVRRAQSVADALAGAGARVLSVQASPGLWHTAVVELSLDGRPATFRIQPYSRDYDLYSVGVPSKPLPHVLVRRERGTDRLGKRLGFNREVQVGDPCFDDAAFLDTAERDDVVRPLFDRAEVRAAMLAVLDAGFGVQMSAAGLHGIRIQSKMTSIDPASVPRAVAAIEALALLLPDVDPSTIGRPHWSRSLTPFLAVMGMFFGGFVLLAVAGALAHPLVEPRHALAGLVAGFALWLACVAVLYYLMRGGTSSLSALLFGAFILLCSVPASGVALAAVANSALDGSPATTHPSRVVALPKNPRKSRRVTFEGWQTGAETVNADVSRSQLATLKVGDPAEVITHAGAFGWDWIETVRF